MPNVKPYVLYIGILIPSSFNVVHPCFSNSFHCKCCYIQQAKCWVMSEICGTVLLSVCFVLKKNWTTITYICYFYFENKGVEHITIVFVCNKLMFNMSISCPAQMYSKLPNTIQHFCTLMYYSAHIKAYICICNQWSSTST